MIMRFGYDSLNGIPDKLFVNALGLVTIHVVTKIIAPLSTCNIEAAYKSCCSRLLQVGLFSPWCSDKILWRIFLCSVGALGSRNSLKTGWITSLFRSSDLSICLVRASTCSLNVGSATVNWTDQQHWTILPFCNRPVMRILLMAHKNRKYEESKLMFHFVWNTYKYSTL